MRNELSRRPSVLVACALICGLVALEHWPAALLFPVLVWLPRELHWRASVVLALGAGMLMSPSKMPQVQDVSLFRGEAVVVSMPDISLRGQQMVVRVEDHLFQATTKFKGILAPGDKLELEGALEPLSEGPARDRDERTLSGRIRIEDRGLKILERGPAMYRLGAAWRAGFVGFVRRWTLPEAFAAIEALCFNVTADLDQKTYTHLQRSGTVHIISASGLHVMIFAGGLTVLLSSLPIPRGWKLALIGTILLFYAVGAGMKPPVIRSVAMAAILGYASMLRKEPDLLSALGAVAVAYLLWRPEAVYDLGFQLSFVTVAALGMFLQMPDEMPTAPVKRVAVVIAEAAKASLVATLASAPLTAYYFGTVSIVSIPANVLIVIVLPVVTLTAFAAHAISFVLPALAVGLLTALVQPLAGWILWVAHTFGNLSVAVLSVPPFSAYWMIPYFAALLLIWRPRARPL